MFSFVPFPLLCRFWLTEFFLILVVISYFVACLVIFYWMPGFVNFAFLAAAYFCIPVNSLELCSQMRLGNNLILSALVRQTEQHLVWSSFFPTNKTRLFWVLESVPHELRVFPGWLQNKHCLWRCRTSVTVPSYPLGWFFPRPGVVSSHHALISTLLAAPGVPLYLSRVLSVQLSSVLSRALSYERCLPCFPSVFSCIHSPPRVFGYPWSPSPCSAGWKCSSGSKAHSRFLTLGERCPSLPDVQCLESCVFLTFCP